MRGFARKLMATGLLCLFSTLCAAPILFSGAESSLPACCRRDGHHHCSVMQTGGLPTDGPAFAAALQKCPLFPTVVSGVKGIHAYLIKARAENAHCVDEPLTSAQSQSPHCSLSVRIELERGPPQFALLG